MDEQKIKKKLNQAYLLIEECLHLVDEQTKTRKRHKTKPTQEKIGAEELALSITNKILELDDFEKIEKKILDKKNMEAKILLCFYIARKYFSNIWLTSGDIEKITSELGIKLDKRNVSNKLKEMRSYLENKTSRKKGRVTPSRINRNGIKKFEKILEED